MATRRKPSLADKVPHVLERRTWRRRAHARPDELLDAALDEFIAKGFDAARIEDIARRAGLSKGAVYLYFSSKEELLRALIVRAAEPVVARVSALAQTGDNPKQTLIAIGHTISMAMVDARIVAIPHLVISIANRFPDLRDFYREKVAGKAKSAVETLIRRGISRGQFRDVDPSAAARALIGPVLMECLWMHVLKGQSSIGADAWLEDQLVVILQGLERR
jgi:AcrR family transcriptional regulator